ncbi:MAG: putative sulfate exporter family transporter [Armatimonadetes bacterium]|nr:putative sulfate exporter family transporter [Armatimonadota bacterium]
MFRSVAKSLPGLGLCTLLALASVAVSESPWAKQNLRFSPLLIVILLGIVIASLTRLPAALDDGIKVAQKPVLRWAVAGLGFKLSLMEILRIGGPALFVVLVSTVAALAAGWWIGVRMGLNEKLAILLGVGTSVCGASAVVAADTVVQAEGEDAAVSLGVITLWGTVGIFVLPLIASTLHLHEFRYGVFAGASLQEMAQVVAAAQGYSDGSAEVATVVKLARICLLAPIVLYLAAWFKRNRGASGEAQVAPVPWFLVAFLVFATVNSFAVNLGIPKNVIDALVRADVVLLSIGMAGVGLKTGFRELKKAGWKPVLLGLYQWLFLSAVAFALSSVLSAPAAPGVAK